jgi:tyrosyl-tRNA synthetase
MYSSLNSYHVTLVSMSKSIKEILERRSIKVLPDINGLERKATNSKIRIYLGVDPTGSRLHLGHTISMRILNDFAKAGHEAIYLFGTGTVQVGDPSLRSEARKLISDEVINKNIETWKVQASKIIDLDKVEIRQNGDWINKLNLSDMIQLMSKVSAVQLFKRESFTRRVEQGNTVWYHETLYPLLQGYDSVVMDVDAEIGGTDQEFNMLVGRELQKKINNKDKWVIENPMIVGTDGKQMSKSSGNCVWLDDKPEDIYGKLMRLPDEHIWEYLRLVTDVDLAEITQLKSDVENGGNPKVAKDRLAYEVVSFLHTDAAADEAKAGFKKQFSDGGLPDDIPKKSTELGERNLYELLVELELASSKSEARRLLEQGGVKQNQQKLSSEEITVSENDIIQVGKRKFIQIIN